MQNEENMVVKVFDYEAGEIVETDGKERMVSRKPLREHALNTLTEVTGFSKSFGYIPLKLSYQGMSEYIAPIYHLQTTQYHGNRGAKGYPAGGANMHGKNQRGDVCKAYRKTS